MQKVAMYLRISEFDGLGESNSIVHQRLLILQYCKQRQEFADCEISEFIDDGVTGTGSRRLGLERLKEEMAQGKIGCVIVKDLSRLGRNYIDVGDLMERYFSDGSIRFISICEYLDTVYMPLAEAALSVAFQNIANDLYSRHLSVQVKASKYTRARQGRMGVGLVCYGYIKDPEDKYGYLIDEPAAAVVRGIFELTVHQNKTTGQIANILNDRAILPPGRHMQEQTRRTNWRFPVEGTSWNSSIVYRILRNERYTGLGIFRQNERLIAGQRETTVKNPREKWITVEDHHPAIISKELFQRAKECLSEKCPVKAPAKRKIGTLFHSLDQGGDLLSEKDERRMKDEQYHLRLELLECYRGYKENSMEKEQFKNRRDELTKKIKADKEQSRRE